MSKCKFTVNDLVNDLWDSMNSNKSGDMDNNRLSSQSKAASQIIRAKAEQRKNKMASNEPSSIPFFEDD